MGSKVKRGKMQWYRMDLHLHTAGSADYQEEGTSALDVLHRAELRGLDIIAFTDHNTIAGYQVMLSEIEQLAFLEGLDRAQPEEKRRLAEYRRLLDKILVLPGFEFTATFGFHILAIFSPEMRPREIEHILLALNVPPQALDEGSSNVGASADVLTAYRAINEAGGIVIAAHANSAHGVAMRGFDFGGQTKIAYTQDSYLHCLEVTDLDRRGRGTTARFFDGSKPEYPRRMRCIQGSDAHRLIKDPRNEKNLGIGDRSTEVLLPESSFEALREMFRSSDFARSRPYRGTDRDTYDYVQAAREEGQSIVQAFHEGMSRRGGALYGVIADVCAMANTNGGTIYVGVSVDARSPVMGIENVSDSIEELRDEIEKKITPPLEVEIDTLETQGKTILRLQVPRGDDPPYAIDDNKIYVRDESETNLAVRDEIVRLVVQRGQTLPPSLPPSAPVQPDSSYRDEAESLHEDRASDPGEALYTADLEERESSSETPENHPKKSRRQRGRKAPAEKLSEKTERPALAGAPRTGVEIIGTEVRKGEHYHIVRDLRNGNIVKNVTQSSARRLWHYAITEREANTLDENAVQWAGDIGLWKRYKRGGVIRYDLIQRDNGNLRVYYGVTEDGMHGAWQQFVSDEAAVEDE